MRVCDRSGSIMRRLWPTTGCWAMWEKISTLSECKPQPGLRLHPGTITEIVNGGPVTNSTY